MASGRSPPPEIAVPVGEEEDREVEEGDAFDIPSKNASYDRLRRWRQAALVLNASRRFRYTLDLEREEEKENLRRMIRAHAQVIRAVFLFKKAGQKELGEFEPLSQRFPIDLEKLVLLNRDHDAIVLQEVGGVSGLSDLLKSNLNRGINSNEDELLKRRGLFGANTYPRKKRKSIWEFNETLVCRNGAVEMDTSWDMIKAVDVWEDDDGNGYVLVKPEDAAEGIAFFVTTYLLTLTKTKELSPDRLQKALKTFSVEKRKGKLWKAWDGTKVMYNVA